MVGSIKSLKYVASYLVDSTSFDENTAGAFTKPHGILFKNSYYFESATNAVMNGIIRYSKLRV